MRSISSLVTDGAILAIQDGNHGGSHPKASEYVLEGIPFIMASDISDGRIDFDACKRLSKERTDQLRIGFAVSGDVLLTHKGTVGQVAIVPPVSDYIMLTPQVTYYRVDAAKLDPRYLSAAFRSPNFQQQLRNISAQSTRPYVAISTQRQLEIPWMRLDDQRRIGSIVGAYDDLIETNRRRVMLLESLVRFIFDEWLVRFRYPGHEITQTNESALRGLPEGWSVGPISSCAEYINRGITPKYDEQGHLVVGQKCIRNNRLSLALARVQSKTPPSEKLIRHGDVVINSTGVGTLGRVAQVEDVPAGTTVDSHVTIARPNANVDPDYFGLSLFRLQPEFERLATGSTGQAELSRQVIESRPITIPPEPVQKRFGSIVRPIRRQIHQLCEANVLLSATRDVLLPRLMSGQLSLADSEGQAVNAATPRELQAAE